MRLNRIGSPMRHEAPTVNVVLIGPQGSGKGTQAERLIPRFGLVRVATGDLFRAAVGSESALGEQVRGLLERGELVPDDLTLQVVRHRLVEILAEEPAGILFDGFPRTQAQAEGLDRILSEHSQRVDMVIEIAVPEPKLIERLAGRLVCSSCGAPYHPKFNPPAEEGVCDLCGGRLEERADDRPEAIRRRLALYDDMTRPLLAYYSAKGLVERVDGDRAIDEVSADIASRLSAAAAPGKA